MFSVVLTLRSLCLQPSVLSGRGLFYTTEVTEKIVEVTEKITEVTEKIAEATEKLCVLCSLTLCSLWLQGREKNDEDDNY